jgi:hypothetical protein
MQLLTTPPKGLESAYSTPAGTPGQRIAVSATTPRRTGRRPGPVVKRAHAISIGADSGPSPIHSSALPVIPIVRRDRPPRGETDLPHRGPPSRGRSSIRQCSQARAASVVSTGLWCARRLATAQGDTGGEGDPTMIRDTVRKLLRLIREGVPPVEGAPHPGDPWPTLRPIQRIPLGGHGALLALPDATGRCRARDRRRARPRERARRRHPNSRRSPFQAVSEPRGR